MPESKVIHLSQLQINATKQAVFAVFDDAESAGTTFAERLLKLGIGDRATARPLAVEWAAKKYGCKINPDGQRGVTLVTGSKNFNTAKDAIVRVLNSIYGAPMGEANKAQAAAVDAVEKLLKAFNKLSAAEKRRFKSRI